MRQLTAILGVFACGLLTFGCADPPLEGTESDGGGGSWQPDVSSAPPVTQCTDGRVELNSPVPEVEGGSLYAATNLLMIGDQVYFDAGKAIYRIPKVGGEPHEVYRRGKESYTYWGYGSNIAVFDEEKILVVDVGTGAKLREIVVVDSEGDRLYGLSPDETYPAPDGHSVFIYSRNIVSDFSNGTSKVTFGITHVDLDTGSVAWNLENAELPEPYPYPTSGFVDEHGELVLLFDYGTSGVHDPHLFRLRPQGTELIPVDVRSTGERPLAHLLGSEDGHVYFLGYDIFSTGIELGRIPEGGGDTEILGGVYQLNDFGGPQWTRSVARFGDKLAMTDPMFGGVLVDGGEVVLVDLCRDRLLMTEEGIYSTDDLGGVTVSFQPWETIVAKNE